MTEPAWTDVLDAFERRIADQRTALERGEADAVPPFEPPPELGPMPPALVARSQALLADVHDVEAELTGALAHIGQDLAVIRRLTASAGRSSGARFLDTVL